MKRARSVHAKAMRGVVAHRAGGETVHPLHQRGYLPRLCVVVTAGATVLVTGGSGGGGGGGGRQVHLTVGMDIGHRFLEPTHTRQTAT